MDTKHQENNELPLDTGLLSDFIFELTICSKSVTSYPSGHPFIKASLEKVMKRIPRLFDFREEVTLGIAKDTLILDENFLDKKNPVYKEYAKILFNHNITALTFEKKIEFEELVHFNEILATSPEKIQEKGGIEQVIADNNIKHIRVKAIRFDLFRVIEKDQVASERDNKNPSVVWEEFVRYLLDGTLDPSGVRPSFMEGMNPEKLVREIYEDIGKDSQGKELNYSELISSYMKKVSGNENIPGRSKAYLDRLNQFVSHLNPELRRQLLSDSFKAFTPKEGYGKEVSSNSQEEAILEALENMNAQSITPSPFVLGLLQKLTNHCHKGGRPEIVQSPREKGAREYGEALTTVFRQQEDSPTFVPESYQETLQGIIRAKPISGLELQEIEALKKSLEGQCADAAIFTIIVELIKSGLIGDHLEALKQNLIDSSRYFLGTGEFQILNELHGRLMDCDLSAITLKSPQVREIVSIFNKPEFVEEVLNSLRIWEKEKYPHIQKLILKIGEPFVEPVLNHLAEEPRLSIRRLLIDCLLEMGEKAKNAALLRLRDKRWYFVRNLVLILRHLNDPWILPPIRRLLGHPHPKVHEEVFKTLLHFKDPEAHRMLLEDLSGKDKEARLIAVGLAENCQSVEVVNRLLELLNKGNLLRSELDLKKKIIQTLGRMRDPSILPHLEKMFRSKSLLHRNALNQLKAEIIRSLEYYPGKEPVSIIEKLSRGGTQEVAHLAFRTPQNMHQRITP